MIHLNLADHTVHRGRPGRGQFLAFVAIGIGMAMLIRRPVQTDLPVEGNAVTTHEAAVRSSALAETTTALFALLGLIDIALLTVIGSADAPPLAVSVGVAALGLITLLALISARRGSRAALRVIVVVRVISALLAIPAFFLKAPAPVIAAEGLLIAGTVLALLLLRRAAAVPHPSGDRHLRPLARTCPDAADAYCRGGPAGRRRAPRHPASGQPHLDH